MDLIQEFSFYSYFEIAPFLFESTARQTCAFCNRAPRSCCAARGAIANQASLQLVHKVTERVYHVTSSKRHNKFVIAPRAAQQDLGARLQNAQL